MSKKYFDLYESKKLNILKMLKKKFITNNTISYNYKI